ncbi:ninein isoform X2 [Nerophis ophidion]|nr:ninein isoform X2 [Nerophis ophidion]
MDDVQEQDHYEERLKELFSSFDGAGCGSLCPGELADLCLSLHLDQATPALLDSLLHNQDRLTARVDFHQFKDALILVLSSGIGAPRAERDPPDSGPESPEIQPKFVKGSKRYGRRSAPVIADTNADLCEDEADSEHPDEGHVAKDNCDSAIPRKRERWNAVETSAEEYQAEGQMHLWNPDEPSTPGASVKAPRLQHLEARFQEACEDLAIAWDGCADRADLLALCDYLGQEISADVVQSLNGDRWINVQDFVAMVLSFSKPATPSASTPYRQLKRHHSTQPFDEVGRRIATPSALVGTIGTRLFSTLDDGTGFTSVESVMDAWTEEGIENSTEILQALNFSLDGKLSLCDLTAALENEFLVTKNIVHQAALASFKAEIRHLLERVDGELREKEKLRSDLEKAERLKNQLATEVDEHHSSIERTNNLNLRKLEQDHREKLAAVRSELMKEMDQIRVQARQQSEELEAEMEKIKDDESFLRDHLSISVKENRHLEMELLDCSEKLKEAQSQVAKLQAGLDNIMKEKFGDLEPSSADVFFQEERIKQLRLAYEAQCRELQDRVDELQSEVRDLHGLGRTQQTCSRPLSEELDSKSPGTESDPGLGSEEVHPFSLSLEAELMLEQQKEQHLHQMDQLRNQLECKINEFSTMLEQQRMTHDHQKDALALQYQQEVQALREELAGVELRTQELQGKLEQAELERTRLEQKQAEESEKLEEVSALRLQLLEAQTRAGELEEQLRNLQDQPVAQNLLTEMEELRKQHESAIDTLEKKNMELLEIRLKEERSKHQEEKDVLEKSWLEGFEREKHLLRQGHREDIRTRLEEARSIFEEEQGQTVQRLTKEWQKERAQLDEQNNESLQALLEEEMLGLLKEQEEKEIQLREQWQSERARLLQRQEEALLDHVAQERLRLREEHEDKEAKLKQEWEVERLQLVDDYEAMLQERLEEEREKHQAEKEAQQKRLQGLLEMKRARQEESHGEAMRELAAKHAEERNSLSGMLDKLRDQVAQERQDTEVSFSQKIEELERRFSADQESVAERFEADVAKLEQHYQSELKRLSESHVRQKLLWEPRLQRALEGAEEQREQTEDAMEQEAERQKQEWTQEQREMKRVHEEVVEAMVKVNQKLNHEMESIKRTSQTKESELSRQLNDLHNQLLESVQTKEQLLAQSNKKATDIELLLEQTVEDFRQEREELLNSHSLLEAKYKEMLSISERQTVERIEVLTERDDFKLRIEEMEKLLKQAADDFEVDREELREHVAILEEKLKGSHAKNASNATLATKILYVSCLNQGIVEDTVIETDAVETNTEDLLLIKQEPCEEQDTMPQVKIQLSENQDQLQISDLSDLWIHNAEMCDDPQAFSSDDDPEECLGTKEKNSEMTTCNPKDSESNEDKKEAFSQRELQFEDFDLSLRTSGALEAHKGEDEPAPGLETLSHQDKLDKVFMDSCELSLDADDNPGSDIGEPVEQDVVFELQSLYLQAKDDNLLLEEKISLLQQKTDLLQSLLEHNNLKIQTGREHLEENYSLKVKQFLLIEHIKVLEMKALKLKELQGLYEDCLCENADLKEQNGKLNKRVWSLERNMSPDFQDELVSPLDQIIVMREENYELAELFREVDINPGSSERPRSCSESSTLKDCCWDCEVNTSNLHKDISELQGEDAGPQASSAVAVRLAEENVSLKQKISSLQEEDLKQAQEDLTRTLEQLDRGKVLAEQAAEDFNKQMSDLCSQSRRLQSENGTLARENARSLTDVETLKKQLAELMKDGERKEVFTGEEKRKLAMCARSLEAELTKALEEMARLEERNSQLTRQVSKLQDKVKTVDESLQAVDHKRVCLKSELRLVQQDRDSFLQEVAVLQKQLQNANDKNYALETVLHSQTPKKKLHREEDDHQLLPDTTSFLSNMQQRASHSSGIKALEHENASLKQEVERQKLVMEGLAAREGLAGMKKLLEENEALKDKVQQLTSQLLESYQSHFAGLLPASPRRTTRGHRVDGDADKAQDSRERRMASMEERMKEIEVSLRNVKMLLREKVAQLRDQVQKNSVADVLIRDLYSKNSQLLEETSKRRRHKMAEKNQEDMLDLHSKLSSPNLPKLRTSPTSPTSDTHFNSHPTSNF